MTDLSKLTANQVRKLVTPQSYDRGQTYASQGAIMVPIRRGTEIEAMCQGSAHAPYRVRAHLGTNDILSASCTCPYDWGGYCKHIVALLLTYIRAPQDFVERKTVDELLKERSHEELVTLVGEMLARYPDLEVLIDRPIAGSTPTGKPLDTSSFRRELRQAMQGYDGWGDHTAEDAMLSVARSAAQFGNAEDWHAARAIYSAILDECLEDAAMFDDDGDFIASLGGVVDGLIECLAHTEIAEDDDERRSTIDSLLDAYIWDVNFGGTGLSDEVPQTILEHLKPEDLDAARERVRTALEKALASGYGSWSSETYGRFLMQLDTIDTDPEQVIVRLREQGLYRLVFEKLLEMGRGDEAIKVTEEYLTRPYERLLAVRDLADAGYTEVAIRLAEETLQTDYREDLTEWLLGQYQKHGDREAQLRLQRQRMHTRPHLSNYEALHKVAESLGQWQDVRSEIVKWLEEQGHIDVLTHVYLYEQDWDAAWDTAEKATTQQGQRLFRPGWGMPLALEVAEKSRFERPHKAIPIYVEQAEARIGYRGRENYHVAASYLATVRDLYHRTNDEAAWKKLIARVREEYHMLPALQDELDKAGL